jgi:hypothetical protein
MFVLSSASTRKEALVKLAIFIEIAVPQPWDHDREANAFTAALTEIETANAAGFDSAWVVENHFLRDACIEEAYRFLPWRGPLPAFGLASWGCDGQQTDSRACSTRRCQHPGSRVRARHPAGRGLLDAIAHHEARGITR